MKHVMIIWAALVTVMFGGASGAWADDAKKGVFDARNEFNINIPKGAHQVRAWFVMPQNDPAQRVSNMKVESPYKHRIVKDSEGNSLIYIEIENPDKESFSVTNSFTVIRKEVRMSVDPKKTRPYTKAGIKGMEKYLSQNKYIVIDEEIKKLASEIVGNEKNPVTASRKIYDWTLHNVDYWVKNPKDKKASKVGDSQYCLLSRTGNCTDFHSLYTAISRAAGIPTRLVYGSFFKAELDGKDKDQSYHCWVEFFAPKIGWIPLDVAIADIFDGEFPLTADNTAYVNLTTADGYSGPDPAKVNYYFGSIEERRVTWTRGRDLLLEPKQAGEPVNAMSKAYVEIDGKESVDWSRKLTYKGIH